MSLTFQGATVDNITAFNNHLPVKVRFGEGVAETLPAVVAELGASKVFLMVDKDIEKFNPAATKLIDQMKTASGIAVTLFEKPAGEPTIQMVDDAIAALKAAGSDVVVALGGGSVIDTAKAARLCAQLNCTFREFQSRPPVYPVATLPLIALPTSAGTGSEVSGGSVISDPEAGRKAGIANGNLRAQVALVDPVLTYSMPPSMTANTGIDALAQAIAGIIAKCSTPIGDAIGYEAVRMMTPALVAAFKDGNDKSARAGMAAGSMMAGLTMNISDCTAEHSLGQAIGGLKHVPHGLTIGLVLVETLTREAKIVPEKMERIADAMGVPQDGSTDGSRCVNAVRKILAELQFPVLSSLGFVEGDIDELAEIALKDFFITQAPKPWSKQEVVDAFKSALRLESRVA
ncbi:MAG: iron-containing alcohol dehydrogenase [Candidatus Planktophila sp.]|nr:iron-containing alcohol dehydrogenase [Candidatus Planktophila sp.]